MCRVLIVLRHSIQVLCISLMLRLFFYFTWGYTSNIPLLGYKIYHSLAPAYFSDIIIQAEPLKSTRYNSAPVLSSASFLPKARCKYYGDRSCFRSICSVFNALPAELRAANSLSIFKKHLKTYLFQSSFKYIFILLRKSTLCFSKRFINNRYYYYYCYYH